MVDGINAIPERVSLPALDLDDIHFVIAELYFPGGQVARSERVFGGELGREIDTDNTAVAVEVEGRRRLRRVEPAEGLVVVDGESARVLAVEHGPAEVVIVRERSSRRERARLTADMQTELFNPLIYGDWAEDRLFFIGPAPRHLITAGAQQALYPMSPALPGSRGNLLHWLVNEGTTRRRSPSRSCPGRWRWRGCWRSPPGGRALRDRIAKQRILWIDGDDLPTEMSLAPDAPARLAGGAR